MKIRTFILFLVLVLITIFVAINWNEFLQQTTISFLFGKVQAPLGLIMLVLLILLSLLFLVYALYLRSSAFISERQISKDLKEARELAEKAEQSRFTELKQIIESEFQKHTVSEQERFEGFESRLEKYREELISTVNELRKIR